MSRKLYQIRKKKGITKKTFAEWVKVDVRTITNWEKEDGTIPSLDLMINISDALEIPMYEVFNCFYIKNDDENEDEHIKETFKPNIPAFYKISTGKSLISFLWFLHCFGSGILQGNDNCFCYSKMFICKEGEFRPFDNNPPIENLFPKYHGIILADSHLNYVVINKEDLISWVVISERYGNLVIKIWVKTNIFETSIYNDQKISTLTLTIMNYKTESDGEYSPGEFMRLRNNQEFFTLFIKDSRLNMNMTQQQFADKINSKIHGSLIDNKIVNKLENGALLPNLKQIAAICECTNTPIAAVLFLFKNGYYYSKIEDPENYFNNMGFNLLFYNSVNHKNFALFISHFKILKNTIDDNTLNWGCLIIREKKSNTILKPIYFKKLFIHDSIIYLENDENKYNYKLMKITPHLNHLNNMFEFKIIINYKNTASHAKLLFVVHER